MHKYIWISSSCILKDKNKLIKVRKLSRNIQKHTFILCIKWKDINYGKVIKIFCTINVFRKPKGINTCAFSRHKKFSYLLNYETSNKIVIYLISVNT